MHWQLGTTPEASPIVRCAASCRPCLIACNSRLPYADSSLKWNSGDR
jgi:hypothetical protein